MRYIQSHVTPLLDHLTFYIEAAFEAFQDINTFLDEHLESDFTTNSVIAGIIATPFVGLMIFIAVVMFSG